MIALLSDPYVLLAIGTVLATLGGWAGKYVVWPALLTALEGHVGKRIDATQTLLGTLHDESLLAIEDERHERQADVVSINEQLGDIRARQREVPK